MEPYRRLGSREAYRNRWVCVEVHDVVHPSGVAGEHVAVVTPKASAVIVVDGDDLVFARQQRFAAGGEVIEIVKGGAEAGESTLACAERELREELGLQAEFWDVLGDVYEIPSIVVHPVTLFVARGISACIKEPEDVESIEPVRMTARAAFERAVNGDIVDAVTLAALLRFGLYTGLLRTTNAT
ncbi:MAG: NUDIX hydrolase [Vulcanimicrobiaceae bacterium]